MCLKSLGTRVVRKVTTKRFVEGKMCGYARLLDDIGDPLKNRGFLDAAPPNLPSIIESLFPHVFFFADDEDLNDVPTTMQNIMHDVKSHKELHDWDMLFFGRCYDHCSKVRLCVIQVLKPICIHEHGIIVVSRVHFSTGRTIVRIEPHFDSARSSGHISGTEHVSRLRALQFCNQKCIKLCGGFGFDLCAEAFGVVNNCFLRNLTALISST